ncbi:F-box domain containing protein, partial [Tanacetum coccineum]
MSDNIPFEVQSEIIKRLPVKSVIQCRSVSKLWKSLIDSTKFINDHNLIHQTQSQHHLFVRYKLGCVKKYLSIIDNDSFPQKKFHLTAPLCVHLLSSGGSLLDMVALWNPAIKKSVGIVIANEYTAIGLGFVPKLVTIDGYIYWLAMDKNNLCDSLKTKFIISYDLKSDKFGEVCFPDSLVQSDVLMVSKENDSLGVLEYHHDSDGLRENGEVMIEMLEDSGEEYGIEV